MRQATGLKVGDKVQVICQPNEADMPVGFVGTIADYNFDAAVWYISLEEDDDGSYMAWELAPVGRNDSRVYR